MPLTLSVARTWEEKQELAKRCASALTMRPVSAAVGSFGPKGPKWLRCTSLAAQKLMIEVMEIPIVFFSLFLHFVVRSVATGPTRNEAHHWHQRSMFHPHHWTAVGKSSIDVFLHGDESKSHTLWHSQTDYCKLLSYFWGWTSSYTTANLVLTRAPCHDGHMIHDLKVKRKRSNRTVTADKNIAAAVVRISDLPSGNLT